ncbi:MAG: hypothetical protein EPN43_04240 [Jatrophihabitans sp.]|nr:MAG: hypothetical protein EPN43_04240 [Jatrophihabitans sp.]
MSGPDGGAEAARDPVAAYRRRMRPWRIGYAAGVVVLVAVALLVVKIAYSHGEISHATLRTAAAPAPSLTPAQPATAVTAAWRTGDRVAIGAPVWGGTVVTYSAHSVTGRDDVTGAVRWQYTRTDRTVCTAAQISGVTVAVYRLAGNCDEVTALNSGTGARDWTRTLDKDGHPLNGQATYSVTPYTLMIASHSAIYAIDPVSGLDRWVFDQPGCTIRGAVLGSSGALISQDCSHPVCGSSQKYCGKGVQLLLRDATEGENSDDATNPSKIKWNLLGNDLTPACADGVICAVRPGTERLALFDVASGKELAPLPLSTPAGATAQVSAYDHGDLVWTGGVTYAVRESGSGYLWTAPTPVLPTVSALSGQQPPALSGAVIAVPGGDGVQMLSPDTGAVTRTVAVPGASGATTVAVLGHGLLVSGPSGTVAYR